MILAGTLKKPLPPPPTRWTIYKIAEKQKYVGDVEAMDEAEAIEKAAKEIQNRRTAALIHFGSV